MYIIDNVRTVLILMLLLKSVDAYAEPIVIYDSGNTKPMAMYYHKYKEREPIPDPVSYQGVQDPIDLQLPIHTSGMSPGRFVSGEYPTPAFMRPFFIVGSDPLSLQWLEQHGARLKAIDAIGVLVEAKSRDDVKRVINAAHGARIMPASGEDIAKQLGISRYPVLISRDYIEQ